MELPLLSLLLCATTLLLYHLINRYTYWYRHGIPTPKGLIPPFGHILPLLTFQDNVVSIIARLYADKPNASMIGFYKLTKPVLLVRESGLVRTILQTNFSSFRDNASAVNEKVDPLVSKHPFFLVGEEWAFGRRRLKYAFTGMRLKLLFESINVVCKKFEVYLEKQLSTSDKYEVELKSFFSKFTAEVMANAGLGIEGQCFAEEGKQRFSFLKLGRALFEPGIWRLFKDSIVLFVPELKDVVKAQFVSKEVDTYFRTAAREALRSREQQNVPKRDFFQLMLEFLRAEGQGFDENVLAAHAFLFFMDGYETSNVTLSLVGHQLAAHPDIQQKAREEVLKVLSAHGGVLTYECVNQMTYLEQVVNESQRHHDTVGVMNKTCTDEFELRGSDGLCYRVKPGTDVFVSIQGMQMDSKYWPDPTTFDPERFSKDKKMNMDVYTFLPFGRGPRYCPGYKFAMLQIKACLATLLKDYRLELSPKMKLPLTISPYFFLSIANGGFWTYVRRL